MALLALAALNPDRFVADPNIERYTSTGKIDLGYLGLLSADAVPALDRLEEPLRSCVLENIRVPAGDGFAGWNAGRAQARAILKRRPAEAEAACLGR